MDSGRELDVLFILTAPPLGYPPGGYDVIYSLAQSLCQKGVSAGILYHADEGTIRRVATDQRIQGYAAGYAGLIAEVAIKGYNSRLIERAVLRPFRKLAGVDYPYDSLNRVHWFYGRRDAKNIRTRNVVATSWRTARFTLEFAQRTRAQGFYFIQNREDDARFTGRDAPIAAQTYKSSLKKIVTNTAAFHRFKADDPLLVHVGFDAERYHMTVPPELRLPASLLVPSRRGESRGSSLIEPVFKLIRERLAVKVNSFGDLRPQWTAQGFRFFERPTSKILARLYNESALFFLPSIVEGMSLPTLEAMNSGAAVVAVRSEGTAEYLKDGVNGVLVPPGKPAQAAEAILNLVRNDESRIQLARAGMQTAKEYTRDRTVVEFRSAIGV